MDKEMIIGLLQNANDAVLRAVRAMPEDKLEWQPLDRGRPALNLLQECSQLPGLIARTLEERSTDWYGEQTEAEQEAERTTLCTVDDCEAVMRRNTDRLADAIKSFPDDQASKQVTLPFGAGGDHSLGELMFGNYWNTTYHEGQINYIQTLYGDRDMH